MTKRDDIYLSEILERIALIKKHLYRVTREKFLKSEIHRAAVTRELEVIGEAANRISQQNRNFYNTIPWSQIIGMRNRLIHEYFDVDYEIVWEVASKELQNIVPVSRYDP